MPRYTFGAQVGASSFVEADTYRIDPGYVTFIKDGEPFLSLAFSKVPVVGVVDDKGRLPIEFDGAPRPD